MPDRSDASSHAFAGGWGALQSSLRHLRKEANLLAGSRALLKVNQPDGFDCPGCAWPDPEKPSAFEFCENGVKAVTFEATSKRVDPEFFEQHAVTDLRSKSHHWLEAQGRLTHPMRYNPRRDRYEPIPWQTAFDEIGGFLRQLDSPNQAIFYTSGRTSNEAAFLYQLFGRLYGTNNFPDCSNMCHESSGAALYEQVGVGKGTVTLHDFSLADAVFCVGQNPGTNHPRMLSTLQEARERGAKIVAVNPLKERGLVAFAHPQRADQMMLGTSTPIATHYVQPMIGGDLALAKGVGKLMLEAEDDHPGQVLDQAFISEHTSGFEAYAKDLRAESWDVIEAQAGLSREAIQQIADVLMGSRRVILCWAMGLTQHKHAVAMIQQWMNLLMLGGHLGRPGAGACPVRGHSNVQGDRTMGITEHPPRSLLEGLRRTFGFEPPTVSGFDVVHAIEALADGRARCFFAMGGNFAAATPDADFTERALMQCDMTVQVSTKLNRSHVVHGKQAYILPCLGRTELDLQAGGLQQVTVEDSMSMVHASVGRNAPASPMLRSEPAIVAGVAKATLGADRLPLVDWDQLVADYNRIREAIESTLPHLFADFNRKLRKPGGFHLPNPVADREWRTPTGKAAFMLSPIPDLSLPAGQLRLMTIRSHDQYNTTIYDLDDRYRGVKGERDVIFMHADDLRERGLGDGDRVDIAAQWNDGRERVLRRFKAMRFDIPRGCCAAYFPEANVLVSAAEYAHKSRTPVSKSIPVTVARAASPDAVESQPVSQSEPARTPTPPTSHPEADPTPAWRTDAPTEPA